MDTDLIHAALMNKSMQRCALKEINAWLKSGGTPDVKIEYGQVKNMLLPACADAGWDGAVQILLAAGANVHVSDNWALRQAAKNGHLSIVRRLLAAGADVHAKNDEALSLAAGNAHQAIVDLLLASGADVHASEDKALRWTTAHGHVAVINTLLAAGADVHAYDDEALYVAIMRGHAAAAAALLAAGTDIARAFGGTTSASRARMRKVLDTMAAAIPEQQRHAAQDGAPNDMPALSALMQAERRRVARTSTTEQHRSTTLRTPPCRPAMP